MQFTEFKTRVMNMFRLDLNSYKEKQLKRRMDSYLVKLKLNDYGELFDLLTKHHGTYEDFLDYITINVSEFFRDPKRFAELPKYIFDLYKKNRSIKIWSAACSIGAEPYSIAIILEELGLSAGSIIDATDLDRNILKKAMDAKYNLESLKHVSPERLNRFFNKQGDIYILKDTIKKRVSFRYHNLLANDYRNGYDLIACRNVTIYFTRAAQDEIYKKFNRSLNPGGILFIGGSEIIFNYREMGFEKLALCLYQKKN